MSEGSKIFGLSMRGILAFEMVTVMCLMSIFKIEIKEPLYSAVLLGLGFYFGQKTQETFGKGAVNEPTSNKN